MPQQRRANRRNNPNGYPPPLPNETEVRFVEACGLRRAELLNLRVREIRQNEEGWVWIHVARQAGRGEREVPVLAGHEDRVLNQIQSLRLFPDFPRVVDVQHARREYATRLYYRLLMARQEKYTFGEYNEEAAQEVMKALGHKNLSVVCRYYLRLRDVPAGLGSTRGTGSASTDQER